MLRKYLRSLIILSAAAALLCSCGLFDKSIPVNVVFTEGDVTASRQASKAAVGIDTISDAYASFGTLMESYTPTDFRMFTNYIYLSNTTDVVNMSVEWPQGTITDADAAMHWANFTEPLTSTPAFEVVPGTYDCFTLMLLDSDSPESPLVVGDGFEVQTTSAISFTDGAATVVKSFYELAPSNFDSEIPSNVFSPMFLYGSRFSASEVISTETPLSELTENSSAPEASSTKGAITVPVSAITIPEDAFSVTIEVVWDLEGIIEKYADNGPAPVNGGNPFYVLADGYWNKMTLNVSIEQFSE